MKKAFTLSEYLAHPEWRVEARGGYPVRILCTHDPDGEIGIIAWIKRDNKTGYEVIPFFKKEGRFFEEDMRDSELDLFLVEPEPELTEFEKAVKELCADAMVNSQCTEDSFVKRHAAELLAAAKRELIPQFVAKHYKQVQEAREDGKAEALKDLPKWKEVDAKYDYPGCITREMDENGDYRYSLSSGRLYEKCEYISLAELSLKLEKE